MKNIKLKGMVFFILLFLLVGVASASEDNMTDTLNIPDETQSEVELSSDDAGDSLSAENDVEEPVSAENNMDKSLSVESNDKLEISSDNDVLSSDYISTARITTSTITSYAGDYITLKATVKNDFGEAQKATVEFRFNGQTYTTTTDSNGVATWTVKCPSSEVWDASSKTKGSILTKKTVYKKYYLCDVTAYGSGYYKNTDNFYVISKKPTVVKKYKIIKKKITKTIKIKNGVRTYKWGKYALVTYKHKGGYGTMIEAVVGKIKSGPIKFYIKEHYKKKGKWKWNKWGKIPKGYSSEYTYGSAIKCDKIKVKYTQVTYKRI